MSLNGRILRLAGPAILTNITIPLLGLCDTAIAGHLGSAEYLAAIALGSMMLNVVFWGFGFLRAGTTGLTANSFGADNGPQSRDILKKSMILAAIVAVMLLILREPMLCLLLEITRPAPEVAAFASKYFNICVWGAPAQLAIMAATGWFIGMQTTAMPMVVSISTNVLNILLSLLLVFPLGLGFEGVAYGTLTAGWCGLVVAVLAIRPLWEKTKGMRTKEGSPRKVTLSRMFSVNSNLFLRSLLMIAVTLAMTTFGARIGTVALAANTVIMQFFLFFSYFMDGFAFAAEALVGRCQGEGSGSQMRLTVRALLRWSLAMAVIFLLIYAAAGVPIANLLTDAQDVRDVVASLRIWIVLLPPLTVAAFIFDGIFIGITRVRSMMWSTLAGASIFFLISLTTPSGNMYYRENILWLAFESYLVARGGLLSIIYFAQHSRKLAKNG